MLYFVLVVQSQLEESCLIDESGDEKVQSKIGIPYFKRTVKVSNGMLSDQTRSVVSPEPVGIISDRRMSIDELEPDGKVINGRGCPKVRAISTAATG